jgi:hypothetical protein
MPQGPIAVQVISNAKTKLNITTKTVIKTGAGRALKLSVITVATGGAVGVYDAATTAGGVTATALFQVGATPWVPAGVVSLDMAYTNGLVVDPGTGGVVAVEYI